VKKKIGRSFNQNTQNFEQHFIENPTPSKNRFEDNFTYYARQEVFEGHAKC
jgi:hypothetical protein